MRSSQNRTGLTLLEIILALALFCGAIAALSQLAWNGTRATVQARLKTQATIRCETKLNEVLAGVEPMQPQNQVPFPDDSRWVWSQKVIPSGTADLVQLEVTVTHKGASQLSTIDVTLKRWARQLAVFQQGAAQGRLEEKKEEERGQ
ncbi:MULTISPECIES: hypothetical protein [unclassified Schlesneria]|uniref:hypothetical protein n=1 Tax=Schlesneria TaxID=656899 RepID=UPI002F16AE5C